MKDLGQTKFCLGLQVEHFLTGIFVHQAAYIQKILEKFIWANYIHQRALWLYDHMI
jgi:hypothetical protein